MFIFRSLFWLTAAFLVIAPQADLRDAAAAAPWTALSATQAAVGALAPQIACDSFECVAARTLVTAAANTPVEPAPAPQPLPPLAADTLSGLIADAAPAAGTATVMIAPVPPRRPATL